MSSATIDTARLGVFDEAQLAVAGFWPCTRDRLGSAIEGICASSLSGAPRSNLDVFEAGEAIWNFGPAPCRGEA